MATKYLYIFTANKLKILYTLRLKICRAVHILLLFRSDFYLNISVILFRAEPALNQPICASFMVCSSITSSELPSSCFSTHFTGYNGERRRRRRKGEGRGYFITFLGCIYSEINLLSYLPRSEFSKTEEGDLVKWLGLIVIGRVRESEGKHALLLQISL